jgi:HSP20 family protein
MKRTDDQGGGTGFEAGFGGILKGLTGLLEKLEGISETAREVSKSGEFTTESGGKPMKGVYGFTVKVGLGDEGVKVEPFGNVHTDSSTGRAIVEEVREPIVDVFEEDDHILVVAEMPGIGSSDLTVELTDDILAISAQHGKARYAKEVLLPHAARRDGMVTSCNYGVVEIRLLR